MKPTMFIHTNYAQLLPAKISAYAAKSRSSSPEAFDVRIVCLEETSELCVNRGRYFRWGDDDEQPSIWNPQDPQAFSPIRRKVPYLMQYQGRALVLDPDAIPVGDVFELMTRDMGDKAILCRKRIKGSGYFTGVMLLDCARLSHWRWYEDLDDLFSCNLCMGPWLWLRTEPSDHIGEIEEKWNHHDTLNDGTRILHYTNRMTQPWLTGLSFYPDFSNRPGVELTGFKHLQNPDSSQERYFFRLLTECIQNEIISIEFLEEQVNQKNLRSDVWNLIQL